MRTAVGPQSAVQDAEEMESCGFLSDLRVFWHFLLGRKLQNPVPPLAFVFMLDPHPGQ